MSPLRPLCVCLFLVLAGVAPLLSAEPPSGPSSEPLAAPASDSGAIIAAEMEPLREALVPLIHAAQADYQVPGLSLALVHKDRILWLEGFGLADPEQQRPARAHTRYRAGSLAKPVTALLVLEQEAEGAIDIDQALGAALPGFKLKRRFDQTAQPITVRQLLSHHAGLPSDLYQGLWSEQPFSSVREQLRDEYAAFPPNLIFSYSNLGYSLLGHLVQTVTEVPFAQYAEERLFEPLALQQTRFSAAFEETGDFAVGHRNGQRFEPLPMRDLPAQGMETSAADLARLSMVLLGAGELDGRQLIRPTLIEAMLEPQNAEVALDMGLSIGLGLFLEEASIAGATRVARHSGNSLGYTAEWVLLPEQGLGVAVLANAGHAGRIVKPLAEAILANAMKLEPEEISADLFVSVAEENKKTRVATRPEGHFATDFGLIAIRPEQDQLCACMTGEQLDLIPYPQGWLGAVPTAEDDARETGAEASSTLRALRQMRLQTRRIDDREVIVAEMAGGEQIIGEKVPPDAVPEAWREQLGEWRVLNPDPGFPVTDLTLKLTDGQLCLSYRMPVLSDDRIQVPVRAVTEELGIIVGLGRTRGDAVRIVERDGQPRLRWSGYLAEPIKADSEASQP